MLTMLVQLLLQLLPAGGFRPPASYLPADMLMLRPYDEQSTLGGAPPLPPPACPPHCAPPIPRFSEINCTFQLMKALSVTEHIEDFNRSGSYLCAPLSAAAKAGAGAGQLLLFFTGTRPSDNTLYIQTAATLGFHAIAISYNNEGAPNGQCSDYPTNQTIINDDCEFNVEEERLFGGNRSAVLWKKRTEPYQLVDAPNSIMSRTELLLKFATMHGLAGSKNWSAFLSSNSSVKTAERGDGTLVAPSGQAMDWSNIVLSGWSRGSAYVSARTLCFLCRRLVWRLTPHYCLQPVHITKYFAAPRLVLFCGLEDYVGNRGPDSKPEPYIYQMKGLTPPENIYGVGGLHGGCCSNWMTNWGRAGLRLPGQSFADAKKDGGVNATTLQAVEDLVKGARRVYLQGPKVGHGTPIYDAQVPRDKTGRPVYTPVWEYLLTTKMAAGIGTIPDEITPCCCIDSRMKQGLYAPRNCSRSVGAQCRATLKLDDDDSTEDQGSQWCPRFHPIKNHYDPSGPIFDEESQRWHLFPDGCAPDGNSNENGNWCHYVSSDLIKWEEQSPLDSHWVGNGDTGSVSVTKQGGEAIALFPALVVGQHQNFQNGLLRQVSISGLSKNVTWSKPVQVAERCDFNRRILISY